MPDEWHGQDEHDDVERGVEGGERDERGLLVDALAAFALPEVFDGAAGEGGGEEAGDGPGGDQSADDVQRSLKVRAARGEDAAVEEEDRDLGRGGAPGEDGLEGVDVLEEEARVGGTNADDMFAETIVGSWTSTSVSN